jgi:hypothetical protein
MFGFSGAAASKLIEVNATDKIGKTRLYSILS